MVYEAKGASELSTKNVQTLRQRCIDVITKASVFDAIRDKYTKPMLEHFAAMGVTMGSNPVQNLLADAAPRLRALRPHQPLPRRHHPKFADPPSPLTDECFSDAQPKTTLQSSLTPYAKSFLFRRKM